MLGTLKKTFRTAWRARPIPFAAMLALGAMCVAGCGGNSPTGPRGPAYTLGIFDAQWISGTDMDGDGYWETRRLAWDADVSDPGLTRSVKAKVYARPSGTATWTLLGTTNCYSITGQSTSDVYYADVSGFPQDSWDFKIDLYECDGTNVAATRGPGDDPDLSGKGFEELAYAIDNVWWTNASDVDQDDCSEAARLYWDADVSGDLTKSVQAKVYYRPTGGGSWSYLLTTNCYTISGTSTSDLAWVDLTGALGAFDFRIDLYECGGSSPVAVLVPADDPDLQDRCFEPPLTIFNAWWTNLVDSDGDGFWESADLTWDADVVGNSGTVSVQARIYYRVVGVSEWTLLRTTDCHVITGGSPLDTYAVRLSSSARACYDFWIDLHDCGGTWPAARRGPADDQDLLGQCLEP